MMKNVQRMMCAAIMAAGFCLAPQPAGAKNADAGLYDPKPPPGSSFIRFLGADAGDGSRESSINGKALEYINYGELSSYFVAEKGRADIEIGSASASADLEEGKYYTAVFHGGDIEVMEDEVGASLSRSQIVFYNLAPGKPLSLKTSDGKVEIIPDVSAGESRAREINPVKVSVAVFDDDRVLRDLGGISLERARSYSVIAYPDNEVKWVPSTTNTTR